VLVAEELHPYDFAYFHPTIHAVRIKAATGMEIVRVIHGEEIFG